MDIKYQIFVSSTFEDLKAERSAVIEQILNLQHIPIGMESFNAADDTQWNYIKRRIDRSDYYLAILAERYGSIEEASGKSYTQKEYEYAVDQGKPVIAFLLDKASRASWPRDKVEFDKQAQLEAFRQLCQGRLVKFWRNADHLGALVSASLAELVVDSPGTGWIRGDSVPPNVLSEIATLSSENRQLKMELDELNKRTSQELIVPADVRLRMERLKKIYIYFRDRNTSQNIKSDMTMLEAFLVLSKSLAVGLNHHTMHYVLSSTRFSIKGDAVVIFEDIYAELATNNLISPSMEDSISSAGRHNKVWYLTEYGSNFVLYAQALVSKIQADQNS